MAGEQPLTFESGQTAATLVELFTSEGCSSCPPAEKWLSRFKTDPGLWKAIVPVAFHVDYWDHLGWSDRFAKREFTERQRRHASAWNSDSVYTPGFAVDGKEWRGWFSGAPLPVHDSRVGILRITLTAAADRLSASFAPEQSSARGFTVEGALIGTGDSDVSRGENTGRKLHHDFVVLEFASAAMKSDDREWNGAMTFHTPQSQKPDAVAAWIVPTDGHDPAQATGGCLKR